MPLNWEYKDPALFMAPGMLWNSEITLVSFPSRALFFLFFFFFLLFWGFCFFVFVDFFFFFQLKEKVQLVADLDLISL